MTSFRDILFPTNISYGAVGGCGWSTRVVTTDSGREYRQQMWARTRGRWTVGHNLRSATEWDQLITFHRSALGKTYGFRFKDWTDCTDNARGILALNSAGNVQLAKYYRVTDIITSTNIDSTRLISKPRPAGTYTDGTIAAVQFFLSGSPVSLTLDYATGKVTGTGGVVSNYTWTGSFDIPCRFDTDEPEFSFDIPTAVGWRGITVMEVRVDDP